MKSTMFAPGIKLMGKLSFRNKFLLLGVLTLLPLVWLMSTYISDSSNRIAFSQKERIGLKVLKDVYPLLNNIAKVRGLTHAHAHGNKEVNKELNATVKKVNGNFITLITTEDKQLQTLKIKTRIQSIRDEWKLIQQGTQKHTARKKFDRYTMLLASIRTYIIHIADISNLILDPDLDTYYLMDGLVIQAPELLERIGNARGLGAGIAAKKSATTIQLSHISGLIYKITLFGQKLDDGVIKVYSKAPQLTQTLQTLSAPLNKQWKKFVALTNSKIILSRKISIESSDYFKAGSKTIRLTNELVNGMFPALDTLLATRISKKKEAMNQTIIVVISIAVLVGYLFFSFSLGAQHSISAINKTVNNLSQGDFSENSHSDSNDEIGAISKNLNNMITNVKHLISQVIQSASHVASTVEQTTETATQAQENLMKQNSEIELVATAINEMSATVQEVALNTSSAAELTQTADTEASDGRKVVTHAINSINLLKNEMDNSTQVIQDLETHSESIGTVLDVIRGIAEQTNLLALNAAIEAARAGEQGRGFAVVADEVRTLASRTQESTEEIDTMIKKLQEGARNAVDAMAQGSKQTGNSVEHAIQAGGALEKISTAVSTIHEMNTQIACAAEEQSNVSEEINLNIVNIRDIAKTTVEGANQMVESSQSLNQNASDLIRLVNEFKV